MTPPGDLCNITSMTTELLDFTWREYARRYGRCSLPAQTIDLDARVPVLWITEGRLP